MITKKSVLIFSAASLALLIALGLFQGSCDYDARGLCWQYWSEIGDFGQNIFIMVPLFVFSLITLRMREEVFRTWIHFAIWFVPLSVVLIIMSPDRGGGMLFPTTRAILSILLPILFSIIYSL